MLRAASLALMVAHASSDGSVSLNAKNFEKKVYGKKSRSAFIKFLAPW